jgi:hypothetical protein
LKEITYPVAVHSCLLPFDIKVEPVVDERYLSAIGNEVKDGRYFRLLPKICRCKKQVTRYEAEQLVETGQAEPIWKMKRQRMVMDIDLIWMAQQAKVPRIDLITTTHIEQAYTSDNPEVSQAAMDYIEEIHVMHTESLIKLIVPFQEDPTEGRLIFCFANEYRTSGGHVD